MNIYGETRRESGEKNFIPFLYQGQYFDEETELAYSRYRYYSPETGLYVSQDPAQLMGGDNFYAFVKDVNSWIDVFGLSGEITVVRLDADSTSGNHYAVFYEKDGQSRTPDFLR